MGVLPAVSLECVQGHQAGHRGQRGRPGQVLPRCVQLVIAPLPACHLWELGHSDMAASAPIKGCTPVIASICQRWNAGSAKYHSMLIRVLYFVLVLACETQDEIKPSMLLAQGTISMGSIGVSTRGRLASGTESGLQEPGYAPSCQYLLVTGYPPARITLPGQSPDVNNTSD